ncbi:MMPL family transporter [Ornithinimicrobium avium]|uniref:MMPL family transporter n=1 Tax=Ornithinimicrobium avium TaxID=2283195 RepID=A0A345NNB0_9MICO|nr:MMPL family transporter [Ornithinimicrobium avium]AXH96518.1 MMPL family transporter [Ornithinimicrobium avium]
MDRLVSLLTGRRAWVLAVLALVIGGWLVGGVGQAEKDPSPLSSLPAGYESTQGQELLQELPDEGTSAAIVLFTADDIRADLPELGTVMQDLAATYDQGNGAQGQPAPAQDGPVGGGGEGQGGPPPGVAGGQGGIPLIPSEDGTAALSVLTVDSASASVARDVVSALRADLDGAVPEGVTAQVTGPAAVQADLASVFDGANITLLAVTASVVALLLIVTYRSPLLWIVPLTVVGVADQVAAVAATRVLALVGVPWDESTVGILSVLVFGAGTNYALLLISRYRDELRNHHDRHEAMALALRRAAEAILFSASTVIVGVLCLLLSVFPSTRGLGLACAVGVVVAAAFVLGVLPGALVALGRWIFWPQVPREGQTVLSESRSAWRRVGDRVALAPARYVVVTLVVLASMAFGLTQLRSGLAPEDQFLRTPEAISAAQRLAESFPAGTSDPVLVVTRTDEQSRVEDLADTLGQVEGVTSATAVPPVEGIGQVRLVLQAEPGSDASRTTVEQVRETLTGQPATYVTGGDASTTDADDGAVRDRLVVMPLILVAVLLALALLLRSVLAPVILVASVVATFSAALGVSWWVFTKIFDFGAIDATMPLLAFVFLVALGVDYNIFLITRTLEEARGHGTREGVLRALGATGGVITSAGILLAAVFAVLGVLPLVVLAQIGVVICIGVLLDTLVVRTILVPAIVRLLGERFWWPRRVGSQGLPHHSEAYVEQL